MPAVHLDSVSFSYTSAVDVVSDVSLSLGPGWHGLVGANGVGKTTLLRLVTGELRPRSGRVVLDPGDAVVGSCPQVVDDLSRRVEEFARSWDGVDAGVRGRLDLDLDQLDRWTTLSPGERRRWQLAACLSGRPDILVVDEPTNHLDRDARSRIVAELGRFEGVGLIVSHDRALLDHLTAATVRMTPGVVRSWAGTYTVASDEWRREEAGQLEARDAMRRERDLTKRRLDDRRRRLDQVQGRDRRRRRTAGVADPDARSIVIKNRQESAARSMSGTAGVDAHRLQRIEQSLGEIDVPRSLGGPIEIDAEGARRPILLSHAGPLAAGATLLVEHLDVDVAPGTRLRVTGANGAGKTTLLRSLLADPPIPPDRILWLPQELTRAERSHLGRALGKLDRHRRGEVMAVAARLGVDPGRVLDSDELSPGEARKLTLAHGLGSKVWVAVLDEPTNHLDLPSVERLEDALAAYQGALVLVTHDDRFAAGLANDELRL